MDGALPSAHWPSVCIGFNTNTNTHTAYPEFNLQSNACEYFLLCPMALDWRFEIM